MVEDLKTVYRELSPFFLIFVGNLIPALGYLFFGWTLSSIILFYTAELIFYELIMLPKTIIYSWREYGIEGPLKTIGLIISWVFFRLLLFGLAFNFMVVIAFAVSPSTGEFDPLVLRAFFDQNLAAVVLLGCGYVYDFLRYYVVGREYEKIPQDAQLKEISVFYVVLLVPIGFLNGFFVLFEASASSWQVTVMFILILFKSAGQILLRHRKIKNFLA